MARTAEQRETHAELLERIASGDHAAFEALYDEFVDVVFTIARTMLRDVKAAEDATQDVWVRIWRVAGSFDTTRASAATWISTIAHRHVIDLMRRARVRAGEQAAAEPGDEVAARLPASSDTEHEAIVRAEAGPAQAALARLPEGQRRALTLAYFEGLTQSEIADRLGKPIGTVKTYMYQGMRSLREILDVADET